MNPYDILGLKKHASDAEIRRAYIRRAKADHPDSGGSEETFQMTLQAYQILKDPARRAHFDRTGDITDPGDKRKEIWSDMLARLGTMIEQALASEADVADFDVREAMIDATRTHLEQIPERARILQKTKIKQEALAKRFTYRGDDQDVLKEVIERKGKELEIALERLETERLIMGELIDFLEKYSYRAGDLETLVYSLKTPGPRYSL